MRRSCRDHRDLTPRFPVGPDEAAFFVHELLARAPAAGAALLWLDDRRQLLDLFAVLCDETEAEDVAGKVLEVERSPVAGVVLGSRLPAPLDRPGPDHLARWRMLRARFEAAAHVELVDWLVVGDDVIWSLSEVD